MKDVALITGSYRGLGLESAKQLIAKGFDVFLTARRVDDARKAAQGLGPKASFVAMDVTNDASIATAVKEVSKKTDHLTVLINNAAIFPDPSKGALETPRAWL